MSECLFLFHQVKGDPFYMHHVKDLISQLATMMPCIVAKDLMSRFAYDEDNCTQVAVLVFSNYNRQFDVAHSLICVTQPMATVAAILFRGNSILLTKKSRDP